MQVTTFEFMLCIFSIIKGKNELLNIHPSIFPTVLSFCTIRNAYFYPLIINALGCIQYFASRPKVSKLSSQAVRGFKGGPLVTRNGSMVGKLFCNGYTNSSPLCNDFRKIFSNTRGLSSGHLYLSWTVNSSFSKDK